MKAFEPPSVRAAIPPSIRPSFMISPWSVPSLKTPLLSFTIFPSASLYCPVIFILSVSSAITSAAIVVAPATAAAAITPAAPPVATVAAVNAIAPATSAPVLTTAAPCCCDSLYFATLSPIDCLEPKAFLKFAALGLSI